MKPLLPLSLAFAAVFLCGCPDTKAPPKIPEPKAALAGPQGIQGQLADAAPLESGLAHT
jgi:hypothetical protein